ncbi:MAG: sulfurtransferase [Burkholderiaceae bacterium]
MVISNGRDQYKNGHIPNAGFADLMSDLVDNTSEYPYAIPAPEKFAAAMAALGVGDTKFVVLYARDFSAWAARVWWMLRWIGFDNAAILDGGLNAWTAAGFPLDKQPAKVEKTTLSISLRPDLIAERDEVFDAISDKGVILIDAMPAAHYRGEMVMYGRAGHIPTAINVPTVFSDDGRFLSNEALSKLHPFDRDKRIITYCGGGISASANAFAMHRIGFYDIAVYMNSLDEWAANPGNPLSVQGQ